MSSRAWRLGVLALLAVLVLGGTAGPAGADERVDAIAGELKRSGIYVTDHTPREIGPRDIPELRRILQRIPVPTFLAITPSLEAKREPLAALLHDRVGQDGLYIVMDERGFDLEGRSFGRAIFPIQDAITVTIYDSPTDSGALLRLRRFVDVLVSTNAAEQARKARERARGDNVPMSFRDRREQQQWRVEAGSTAVGAAVAASAIHWLRLRRRRTRGGGLGWAASALTPFLLAGSVLGGLAITASDTLGAGPTGGGRLPAAYGAGDAERTMDWTRIDRVITGLKRSPLFVDPDLGHLVAPEERPALEAALRDAGVPVHVVVLPRLFDDESAGQPDSFIFNLHDRFGQPGVYLTVEQDGGFNLEGFELARDIRIPFAVVDSPSPDASPRVPARLRTVIDTIRQSPPGEPSTPRRYSTPEPIEPPNRSPGQPTETLLRSAAIGFFVAGPLVGVPLYFVGLLLLALLRLLLDRGRFAGTTSADVPGPGGLPLRDPNAPVEPDLQWLRRKAKDELTALDVALAADSAAPVGLGQWDRPAGSPGRSPASANARSKARSARDAAALLLGAEPDHLTLVAAVVLARDGRRVLGGPARRMLAVPCAVNPLHGPAVRRRHASLCGMAIRPIPLCPRCSRLRPTNRDKHVLLVEADGEPVPYLQVPSFWPEDPSDATGPTLTARVREHLEVG